jgi:hypothetical protein
MAKCSRAGGGRSCGRGATSRSLWVILNPGEVLVVRLTAQTKHDYVIEYKFKWRCVSERCGKM